MTTRFLVLSFCLVSLCAVVSLAQPESSAAYDPSANPRDDLKWAIEEAEKQNKRIVLVVGGEWCVWCHVLDDFVAKNSDIRKLWISNYVTIKVNFSRENKNEEFLSQYPKIQGYPHIFVLEKDGSFLHSQRTAKLESGRSYSRKKMKSFLEAWSQ